VKIPSGCPVRNPIIFDEHAPEMDQIMEREMSLPYLPDKYGAMLSYQTVVRTHVRDSPALIGASETTSA
jgi:hypothetical protein